VEVLLDNKTEYHPNMVARLNINDYQSSGQVIVIPVRTILKDEKGATYVMLADGAKAKKQIVITGKEYGGRVEIESGLKQGDLLLIAGYDVVNEGDAVLYKK
jgi:multidrug efflux pump subunit AcrA (membrane-fusion protein)